MVQSGGAGAGRQGMMHCSYTAGFPAFSLAQLCFERGRRATRGLEAVAGKKHSWERRSDRAETKK